MVASATSARIPPLSLNTKIVLWVHAHPTTIKVIKISTLILGVATLASLPFTAPLLTTGYIVAIAVTGSILIVASLVAIIALDRLVPPHHNMKNHVFKPGQCEGGTLYYEGDVPILSLNSDDPHKAGTAHGYLCGHAINLIAKKLHSLQVLQKATSLPPEFFTSLKNTIPKQYLTEMQGLLEGYNQWGNENKRLCPTPMTLNDILLLQLIPDSTHFYPHQFKMTSGQLQFQNNFNRAPASGVACTAIVDRTDKDGFVFARNMDWPSFGLMGTYSLVINRRYSNHLHNTVEVGIPGLVGTLTGMNDRGLSIAMNVCLGLTKNIKGMPAIFYNRSCLEQCADIKELNQFISKTNPLGPYHLTAADPTEAQSTHFYQFLTKNYMKKHSPHAVRKWALNTPLSTLNYNYTPDRSNDLSDSNIREEIINDFLARKRPLEEALNLPYVNNSTTTHRVVMKPQTKSFQVAFDNAFAGKEPLHKVSTHLLFTR